MATPDSPHEPRVTETPLPVFQADAPTDVELGVTTSDDTGSGWATPTPRATTSTGDLGLIMLLAGGFKARYLVIRHGWHRRRH